MRPGAKEFVEGSLFTMSQVNHSDELDVQTQSSVTPEHEEFALEAMGPLAGLTAQLINVVAKSEHKAGWHFDVEALTKKSLYHFVSLFAMGEPTILDFGDHKIPIIYFASGYCLARALFENCVVLRYIFDRADPDQRRSWHAIWRLDGHLSRQKHLGMESFVENGRTPAELYPEKAAINAQCIQEYQALLRESEFFESLAAVTNPVSGNPVNQQDLALRGEWRRIGYPTGKIGWEALAEQVGLKRYYGGVPYSLASSYTHSLPSYFSFPSWRGLRS